MKAQMENGFIYVSEEADWALLAAGSFFEGYSEKDDIYDEV